MNREMVSQLGKRIVELERENIALKQTPAYDRGVRDCANLIRAIAEIEPVYNIGMLKRKLADMLERELLRKET